MAWELDVSISFAEIFLFPLTKGFEPIYYWIEGFNLLCGDFFISTPVPRRLHLIIASQFQSPLRRFFYFHWRPDPDKIQLELLVSISFAEIFLFPLSRLGERLGG